MNPDKGALDKLRIDRGSTQERRFPRGLIVLLFLLLLALATGGWWWLRPRAATVQVAVARELAGQEPTTVLNASGYVTARRQATVSSKITGKVIEVRFEEGLAVKEGQVLARLDAANAQANLKLAEAQVEAARVALAETRVRLLEAERERRRITGLAKDRVASPADLDRAQAEHESLQARLERQQAEVTVAERQQALARQQVEDTVVCAPFSGVIVSKNAQPGEMISPMSAGGGFTRTGIGTIVDMDSLEIEIDVNESFINRVKPGQPVVATLDSYPDWKIPAKVIAIIPTADRQKATVKVRVGFVQLDPRILPDMGVKVAFQGSADQANVSRVVVIPKAALQQEDGRDVVIVVQNGRVERRAIKCGATRDQELVVLAGLAAGEKVVLNNAGRFRDGDQIKETIR